MHATLNFVEMANRNTGNLEKILCPCKCCRNLTRHTGKDVYEHLVINGMDPTYTTWFHHGEEPTAAQKPKQVEISEAHNLYSSTYARDADHLEPLDKAREDNFAKELEDAETPLYPGCENYTKLSAIVTLYKIKAESGWSDESFTKLLASLHHMFPRDNAMLCSVKEVRKFLKTFELCYKKIDACVKDCCLFWKENAQLDNCPKCGCSRWKVNAKTKKIVTGVPAKVLRYFPIIPKFQNMYRSLEMAKDLTWHSTHGSTDGMMRHPVDSPTWKTIDAKWPSFSADPRNLRLGLATDGFNPFGDLSSTYSCWPVMLVTYNLPPWLWLKKENVLLTLLIPGPKQPGNDIDVYLQPLIEDLKLLWTNGATMYDKFTGSTFTMRAILMWTMNDYPALGNLVGCTTKGKTACPLCAFNTFSQWLKFSRKTVYLGHRRFLPQSHPFRREKSWFDGKEEQGKKPRIMTGREISVALKDFENDWGKGGKKKRKRDIEDKEMWKKRSIFFDLEYWEELPVRHNLDVMHIIKNICESIIGTLLDMDGKSKDGLNARKDLQHLGIRHDLHPQDRGSKTYLPPASFTLSKAEKQIFCKRLFDLKVPDGYSSNISNCVDMEKLKITGLKSHDCHVLMLQLLPVALKGLLQPGPRNAILRLCAFFNRLCQKVIDREEIASLEDEIVETLCMFERFFPPSFFDIMVHLPIHLGREARLSGPVQYRWMYLFERHMKIFKGNVRNRARPEGCIAECNLVEECLAFCCKHMNKSVGANTRGLRNQDFENDVILEGRPISAGTSITLSDELLESAHRYVLFNTAIVEPYLEIYVEELKKLNPSLGLQKNKSLLLKRHADNFPKWLKEKIQVKSCTDNELEKLQWLANGPRKNAMSYTGYIINGQRFHTKEAEKSTQNSGVSIDATTMCRSSAKDNAQVVDVVSYYGVIKDIVLLDYYKFQLPTFKCDWANIGHGVKLEDGFTLVNLHQGQTQYEKEPFVLASQAKQVFYSRDTDTSNWYVVLKAPPRGFYDMEMYEETVDSRPQDVSTLGMNIDDDDENITNVRGDDEGTLL